MSMKKILLGMLMVSAASGAAGAQERFVAYMTGAQVVPAVATPAKGTCTFVVNVAQLFATVTCTFSGLSSNATGAHTGNAAVGATGPALFNYPNVPQATSGTIGPSSFKYTLQQILDMRAHKHYATIRSVTFPGGELRGQIKQVSTVWDNDGDGRTDPAVFRQSTNRMWSLNSLNGASDSTSVGTGAGDIFMNNTGDFDGDGRADPLLLKTQSFQNAVTWLILQTTGPTRNVWWGSFAAPNLDVAVPADYNGDGKEDIAMFRRSSGAWYIIESGTEAQRTLAWGSPNDIPAIGDYDGDGTADLTVVRAANGQLIWYTLRTSDGQFTVTTWGSTATDSVANFAPFDIDGDGKQDICVIRSVGGQRQFIALQSSNSQAVYINWGLTTDTALYGDYDGDGKTDLVARRNAGGQLAWYILRSSDQQMQLVYWGLPSDQ
jgi:hypothetical protein